MIFGRRIDSKGGIFSGAAGVFWTRSALGGAAEAMESAPKCAGTAAGVARTARWRLTRGVPRALPADFRRGQDVPSRHLEAHGHLHRARAAHAQLLASRGHIQRAVQSLDAAALRIRPLPLGGFLFLPAPGESRFERPFRGAAPMAGWHRPRR